MVKQGDIIKINFAPVVGHEEDKFKPGLVVSNNDYNSYCGGIVLVCPISHAKDFPLHIDLPEGLTCVEKYYADVRITLPKEEEPKEEEPKEETEE